MLYPLPFWNNCYNNQGCSKTDHGKTSKYIWYFAQFYILFQRTGEASTSCKPPHPLISKGAVTLTTEKSKSDFCFLFF